MERIAQILEWRALRYLVSGGTALAADLLVLYLLVEFAHVWYLAAAVCGFLVGMVVSFVMQKFFTFGDWRGAVIPRQAGLHASLQTINLGVNTALMYGAVSLLGVPYLVAQVAISGSIAVYSFLLYRRYVFVPEAH